MLTLRDQEDMEFFRALNIKSQSLQQHIKQLDSEIETLKIEVRRKAT